MHQIIYTQSRDIKGLITAWNASQVAWEDNQTEWRRTNKALTKEISNLNSDIVGLNRERARGRDPLTVTTPPLEAERHKKSMKLPNPEPLTDGITPLIDDFVATIKNILTANADYYLTTASRIAFIES